MDKTKKYLAAFIAAATVLTMAGCGENETADSKTPTSNTQSTADNTADKGTSNKTESTEETKAPAGKIGDRPKLTIALDGGKTFTYNGENFKDVYQQLTDLGLVTEEAKTDYEKDGVFNSGYLTANNGTTFCIDYLPNKKQFIIRTGDGIRDKVAWDIKIGKIDNKTTIGELIDMGATAVTEKNAHSAGYRTLSYLLTSENFETKGVSIDASGYRTLLPEDLVVGAIFITYSGVEAESVTQSEAVTEDDPYAYLELINADYESCYNTMAHDACVVDGIAYFYAVSVDPNFGTFSDEKGYYSYNISTGETKCIVPYEKYFNHACYANGQIYAIVSNEVRCYDLDGNILKSYDFNYLNGIIYAYNFIIEAVMADGSCVIGDSTHSKNHYLISNDFTSAKLICETKEGVHGITEEIPYACIIGGRGNILYAAEDGSNKVFYGIDVTTGEKTEYEVPDLGGEGWRAYSVALFGTEYYKCGGDIKKVDTGETIATAGGSPSFYYGGEYFYNIEFSVNNDMFALVIQKYPNNDGDAEKTVLFEYKSGDDTDFTFLNDEYYLVTDEYGTFLRNINSDEEKQITFE